MNGNDCFGNVTTYPCAVGSLTQLRAGEGGSLKASLRFFVWYCQMARDGKLKLSDLTDIHCGHSVKFWSKVSSGHQVRSADPPSKKFATTPWLQLT